VLRVQLHRSGRKGRIASATQSVLRCNLGAGLRPSD
jgi:hypothetical protein